eukprot:TRINITY_DN9621_c0_g1_i2.p1 TRINITY_DN9621_c0_g1~~TRINITY_DN9621_c0_g1_i2.p1  ORF type:complete len:296 (-),score=33.73 TRINITY_DN9621_c0_g1_i2:305-1069(-)
MQEMFATFSKCGIIKEDDNGQPMIKLYRERESGEVKGDGLVTYLKQASVDLACQILDGAPFRIDLQETLSVEPAQFTQLPNRKKKQGEKNGQTPKKKDKPRRKGRNNQEHLLNWSGTDDKTKSTEVMVILQHMFHPDQLYVNPLEAEDLESDIRSECAKLGRIDKVRIYKHNAEGIVMVRFALPDSAQKCIQKMNGRWYGGRQIKASLWDGFTNYNVKPQENAKEQERRLEQFAKELENKEKTDLPSNQAFGKI